MGSDTQREHARFPQSEVWSLTVLGRACSEPQQPASQERLQAQRAPCGAAQIHHDSSERQAVGAPEQIESPSPDARYLRQHLTHSYQKQRRPQTRRRMKAAWAVSQSTKERGQGSNLVSSKPLSKNRHQGQAVTRVMTREEMTWAATKLSPKSALTQLTAGRRYRPGQGVRRQRCHQCRRRHLDPGDHAPRPRGLAAIQGRREGYLRRSLAEIPSAMSDWQQVHHD